MLVTWVNIRPHALNMYMPMTYYKIIINFLINFIIKFYLKSVYSSDRQVFFAKFTTIKPMKLTEKEKVSHQVSLILLDQIHLVY